MHCCNDKFRNDRVWPMDTSTVQEIYDEDEERRVVIFRRGDGTFFYEEEYFSKHEHEMCWIPKKKQTIGFYDSRETALREAIANTDWLRWTLTSGDGPEQ